MEPQKLTFLKVLGTAIKTGASIMEQQSQGGRKKVRKGGCTPCQAMDNVERVKKKVRARFA